jgi:outer membrane protein, multidrug efflux system
LGGTNDALGRLVRTQRQATALAAALLCGSCAVGPNYRKPDADLPARWAATASTATSQASADISRWWRALGDSTLSALIEEALTSSPDVRLPQARLRQARAQQTASGAAHYPSLSAGASASRSGVTGSLGGTPSTPVAGTTAVGGTQLQAGFDVSWEVDVFGRTRRRVEAATADRQATEEALNGAHVSLAAEVARNYYELRALQGRLEIARRNLASQAETLELAGFRAQAGLVSTQDVDQARANQQQTRGQIPTLETQIAQTEHRLDVLLGSAPGTLHARLAGGGSLPAVPSSIAVTIPADTLRQRPDVRSAERTLAAETARVGVATAALYPSFSLSGSIGLDALTTGVVGGVYSLLGGITAPLFNGGKLRAQREAQDAVREQALIAYQKIILGALEEVENALVALAQNRERVDALTNAVTAARSAAQLARQRYTAGLTDFQSVLDTDRTVLSLEDSLASSRGDGVLSLVGLYKALGGGWSAKETA